MNITKALAALRALALLIPIIVELAKSLDDIEGDGAAKLPDRIGSRESGLRADQGLRHRLGYASSR